MKEEKSIKSKVVYAKLCVTTVSVLVYAKMFYAKNSVQAKLDFPVQAKLCLGGINVSVSVYAKLCVIAVTMSVYATLFYAKISVQTKLFWSLQAKMYSGAITVSVSVQAELFLM